MKIFQNNAPIVELKSHILSEKSTLRKALDIINLNTPKIALVCKNSGHLVRTITDGDIRRALLGGLTLSVQVNQLPEASPVTCQENIDTSEALRLMNEKHVNIVVVCDSRNIPVGLIDRTALQETILLSPPHMGGAEVGLVQQAFEDNWIAPAGPHLQSFENSLAKMSSMRHCVALSSGTAAIHLALKALDLKKGTRVYVSDLTFVGSVQPVFYEDLEPVFIDSDPDTWNMSVSALKRQIAKDKSVEKKIGALILVHLYGQSADLRHILPICQENGIPIIEDAAESLGAVYDGRPSGSHGLISIYSFNGNKIITTSGGGALLTNDETIAQKVRFLASQGREACEHYQHSSVAYNYRMSNILASVGLGQLTVLDKRVKARHNIFDTYMSSLSHFNGISFQKEYPNSLGNRWLSVIQLCPNVFNIHPYQVIRSLMELAIEARPGWKPLHMQPLCQGFDFSPHSSDEVASSKHFLQSICLPSGSSMSHDYQFRVIDSLTNNLQKGVR